MSNCPSCDSKNTKTLAMIWAGGSRTGQSGFGGVSVSTSGRISVGGGRGRSASQSHLAAGCAPPKNSSMPKSVVVVLFLMFAMPLLKGALSVFSEPKLMDGILNFIICAPLLGLLIWGLIKLYAKMESQNKTALSNYSKTWMCLRCGTQFKPYD